MKTTFDLPDPLVRRAKALAAEQGRPLRDLVAEAIAEKLLSPPPLVVGGKKVPVGRREGRRETWEEWKSHLVQQPDGTWLNKDGIADESFFESLEAIRREPWADRDPFADHD
ncbi:MAG: hypothetical protein ABI639_14305 [Thermoanaerobaculia bacterium]